MGGHPLTKPRLLEVLYRVWSGQITTKSDLARHYADEVAEAASRGWITTEIIRPVFSDYGRQWRITASGVTALHVAQKKDTRKRCPIKVSRRGSKIRQHA